ncbi:YncE family protein [Pseudomonas sp. MWU15-20650]|uniref:YncE family protein n=1 Tax=Pseudomonas sp. MWU15-20650 TaxID=2933107 RepID=UPI00200FA02E|nr:YncE family protein [Pseudomonas sp. MWU15-20650]
MEPALSAPPPVSQLAPYIPGLTTPVVGFSGGVYQQLLEGHGSAGLICILRAYAGQLEGDFIELFCTDLLVPVDFHTVTEQEAREEKPIPLHISASRLPDGTVGPVFFRVTHLDHRKEETHRLTLKVDTVSPADREPITSPPWVNEQLPRPQPTLTFIDSAAAGRGVAIRIGFYPGDLNRPVATYRAARDRIRLSIGGQIIEYPVTENEASTRNPITLTVYYATWLRIGSGFHACSYDVIDEVGNYSPGRSAEQILEVRLNPDERLLDPAQIVEAPSGTLDADRLAGKDATLRVAIAGKGWAPGDGIRLTIRGRSLGGGDVEQTYNASLPSTTVPFTDVPWPNADVRVLIGALIQLSYERIRPDQANLPSDNAFVQVTGTPDQSSLAAPQVPAASGGVLHPLTDPVTVTITTYTGQKPHDRVTLVAQGTYANGHLFYQEHVLEAGLGNVVFELPNGVDGDIRQLDGGHLMFYYYVNKAGDRPPSDILTLDIGAPQDALPRPEVREAPAPGFTFDPEVSRGNANVLVRAHASFTEGATVTLYVEGSAMGGSPPPDSFQITPPWVGQDLPFVIARVFVVANLTGSARIYYRVEKAGQRTRYSLALLMRVGSALQLPVPWILESTITSPTTARLNPLHVLPPAWPVFTFRVSYSPMLASDDIHPKFIGTYGLGTPQIKPRPGDPVRGYVDFILDNRVIGANLGRTAELSYDVIRANTTTHSQVLTLTIDSLAEQALDLVSVPQASGSIINANAAHSVVINEWPFMNVGDPVWIDIKGAANLALRNGTPLTPAQFNAKRVEVDLPPDYLRSLPNQSALSIEVRVSLNGSVHKDFAVALRTVNYRIANTAGIFATIPVGNSPNALALSPDGTRLYVACIVGSPSIWVIDTLRNRVLDHFDVPGSPLRMAVHPTANHLYVTDNSSSTDTPIRIYSTQDYSLIDTLTGFTNVNGIALNTNGSRLYVADNGASQLVIINTATRQRLASIPVRAPIDVTLSPDNNRAHVATFYDWSIVDLRSNTLINSADTRSSPVTIAHAPRGSQVYISGRAGGIVSIGDTATQRISRTLTGLQGPFDIAFERQRDLAYVSQTDANLLGIIDTRARQMIGSYAGFNKPRGVVVAPDGSHGYVANIGGDSVSLVVF